MTSKNDCVNVKDKEITQTQLNFLDFCEKFGWGKLEVVIKDGQPVMVSPIKQDFKMTEP